MTNAKLNSTPINNHAGAVAGVLAFSLWGLLVLLWIPLKDIPPTQILTYRIFFSAITLIPIVYFFKKIPSIKEALSSPKILKLIALSAIIIGLNWYLYIWSVLQGKIIEISLGYYMSPLINVLLGRIIFKEYATRLQLIAIGIAFMGMLWSAIAYGTIPYLSIVLALLFSLYGLARKIIPVDALTVTFLESLFLLPLALAWFALSYSQIEVHFFSFSTTQQTLILFSGIATSLPLILYGYAAKRLQLSTLGILDYISPSITFLIGIIVIGEKLSMDTLITFICIWIALALYLYCAISTMHTHSKTIQIYQNKAIKRAKGNKRDKSYKKSKK